MRTASKRKIIPKKDLKGRTKPIFIEVLDYDGDDGYALDNPPAGWALVRPSWAVTWYCLDTMAHQYHFEDYGKLWIAYDDEPEGYVNKEWDLKRRRRNDNDQT